MSNLQVTVFGGTGYLGQFIVRRLGQVSYRVRVAVRHPRADLFQDMGDTVQQLQADVTDAASVTTAIDHAEWVINAVGLYVETDAVSFDAVHVEGARTVAQQSMAMGARLVHVSGIGVDPQSRSRYVRARALGEQRVRSVAPNATILRPSVLFGPQDAFIQALSNVIRLLPIVPLFGTGTTRLQPVHVEDVAEATARVLDDVDSQGSIYELGGPRIYTYRQLLEILRKRLKRRRWFLPVPFFVWEVLAAMAKLLRHPPLTRDQITLMRGDNIVGTSNLTFHDVGITPRVLEEFISQ